MPPPHFLVFIPGYMGSRLRHRPSGETVWLDLPGLVRAPGSIADALDRMFRRMRYPNPDVVPDGVVDDVVFLPPLFKLEQYSRLLNALQDMGYGINHPNPANQLAAYTFAYDWRQDNRISARQLGAFVAHLQGLHPGAGPILIGHSNGGIVARWYIEKEGGKDHVARLFLLASPRDGAPKAFQVLQEGLEVFLLRLFSRAEANLQARIRQTVLTFPSFYQLIPAVPFLRRPDLQLLDLFADTGWLPGDAQRDLLLDGRRFNQELGDTLSVDTVCIFGVKQLTTTGCRVRLDAAGRWSGFDWERGDEGDGTVPLYSAVHPRAQQKLPYSASHGEIYVARPVLDKLQFELLTQYDVGAQVEVTTPRLRVYFDVEGDAFRPGDAVRAWADVALQPDRRPVYGAEVQARFEFAQALPGFASPPIAPTTAAPLRESGLVPGRYEGVLPAPAASGYYHLVAEVQVPGEATVSLEELVLVEADELLPVSEEAG